MKWSILGLVILGIVAAGCAALLVAAVRAEGRGTPSAGGQQPSEVEILIAAKDLPALAVVDAKSVLTKTVPKEEAPPDGMSSPVSVIGKVLSRGMVEGQPFTTTCFATEGTGMELAAALPEGMRAVTISMSEHSSLKGLLYPGSVVDVLASFKLTSRQEELGHAVSIVLLQGIEVLAVEDRTIVSRGKDGLPESSRAGSYARNINVTLLVTPRQAEALQLAASNGTLSLAMRNPLDLAPTDRRATVLTDLSDEFLSRLADTIQPGSEPDSQRTPPGPGQAHPGAGPSAPTAVAPRAPSAPVMIDPPARPVDAAAPQWQLVVIRGGHKEKHSFPVPDSQQRQ